MTSKRSFLTGGGLAAVAGIGTVLALLTPISPAQSAVACTVNYTVSQWSGGFVADVRINNQGDAVNGWRLTWSFTAGQQVTSGWNATVTQSGSAVTATNMSYNAALASGASTGFGFQGTSNGTTNPVPASFALNGTTCSGGGGGGGGGTTTTTTTTTTRTTSTTRTTTTSSGGGGGGGNTTGLVGWGAGTTGGAGGTTVTVTSASALDTALQSSSPTVVQVSGMISLSGMHKVASNKTVIGVGSGSGITGGGLNVANATNVIIRNLNFRNANDDAINVQYSTKVWIDHNDLSNGYDGLIDVKRSSDYVTISWNHLHDHDKSMLLGHDDGNAGEDVGHLRVTYHHNWLDGTGQRHPRVRFGNPVHVYNNYYSNIGDYGVASTMNAGVLVESNYFENVEDPFHLGEGDSGPGSLVARNNHMVNSGSGQTGGSVASIPYSYSVDTASSVKSIVTAGAGTGRI